MANASSGLRKALVVLVVAAAAAGAAPLTWHLSGHHRVIPPVADLRPAAQDESAPVDLSQVRTLAPFGRVTVETADPVAQPDLQLQMILLGVIVRDDPTRSMALINVNGEEANFRPGDRIVEGAVLSDVARDHVLIDIDGEMRRLSFAGEEAAQRGEDVPTGADRLRDMVFTGGGASISEQFDAAQRAQPETTQDYIDMWRERIKANPAEVLETLGVEATENGYRIGEEHDKGINRAGLKAGDIVKTVNGEAVGNVERDRKFYDTVAESGLARIEIERNGRTIVMSFPLQ